MTKGCRCKPANGERKEPNPVPSYYKIEGVETNCKTDFVTV